MTPSPANFPPVHEISSDTESDEENQGPFWYNPKKNKYSYYPNTRLPVVVYTPPPGIDCIQREGKWLFGVPVWNQETGRKALDNFHQMLRDYLYGNNAFSGNMDLEKLFYVAEELVRVVNIMEKEQAKHKQ